MVRNRAERAVLGVPHDPEAARAAHAAGPGATLNIGLRAKSGAWGERPFGGPGPSNDWATAA